jgi:hypothetical protein
MLSAAAFIFGVSPFAIAVDVHGRPEQHVPGADAASQTATRRSGSSTPRSRSGGDRVLVRHRRRRRPRRAFHASVWLLPVPICVRAYDV